MAGLAPPTRVLGLDPGLASVGYAVIDGPSSYTLVEAGVISTAAHTAVPRRLSQIYDETRALIAQFQPQTLAVEKLFFKKNVTTGINVAQARGVLLLAGCELALYEYTPLEVKRRVTGSGKAQKAQVQVMVQRLLALRCVPRPDDAAAAVAIALCCLLDRRTPLAQLQRARGRA